MACDEGSLAIVQQLLERQANPNLLGGPEVTALNAAARSGQLDVVKILLQYGAELNPNVDYQRGNALWMACAYGGKDIAEYLLGQGCNWDKPDSKDRLPIAIAAEEGYADIVVLLLQYDHRPESHEKALLSAAEADEPDVVRVLVQHCPMISHGDAFYEAASSGCTEIVEILTADGVDQGVLEKSLYEAVDNQYEGTVRVLLNMGINPNSEGPE